MENDSQQCFNCGYFYDDEVTYYSEDFARYWSPSPIFSVNWCFHCRKVTTYKQVKAFGLFKIQAVRPEKIMSLEEFAASPLGKQDDFETGKVITQLIRLIWHCLLEHQTTETKRVDDQYPTFELAINTLSPEIVAFMMRILMNYNLFADLPRQIQEGLYVSGWYSDYLISKWMDKLENHPNTQRVKYILEQYKSNG